MTNLRKVLYITPVDHPARFRRPPAVRPPFRVERAEEALAPGRLRDPLQAARRALFPAEDPRMRLALRVVHRPDQVPCPAGNPFVRRPVPVRHHPRHPQPPAPVRAAALRRAVVAFLVEWLRHLGHRVFQDPVARNAVRPAVEQAVDAPGSRSDPSGAEGSAPKHPTPSPRRPGPAVRPAPSRRAP